MCLTDLAFRDLHQPDHFIRAPPSITKKACRLFMIWKMLPAPADLIEYGHGYQL